MFFIAVQHLFKCEEVTSCLNQPNIGRGWVFRDIKPDKLREIASADFMKFYPIRQFVFRKTANCHQNSEKRNHVTFMIFKIFFFTRETKGCLEVNTTSFVLREDNMLLMFLKHHPSKRVRLISRIVYDNE